MADPHAFKRGLSQMFNYLGQNLLPMIQYQQQQKLDEQRQAEITNYRDWQKLQRENELKLQQEQFDLRKNKFLSKQEQDYQAGLEKQFVGGLASKFGTGASDMQRALLAKQIYDATGFVPKGYNVPKKEKATKLSSTVSPSGLPVSALKELGEQSLNAFYQSRLPEPVTPEDSMYASFGIYDPKQPPITQETLDSATQAYLNPFYSVGGYKQQSQSPLQGLSNLRLEAPVNQPSTTASTGGGFNLTEDFIDKLIESLEGK